MLEDVEHLLWVAAMQDYSVDRERAEQLAAELRETRAFLRNEAGALTFDDEPSTFRVVQALGAINDE